MAPDPVVFLLSDGTSLTVPEADLRDVYEGLWGLSDLAGAVSTAALLIEEARRHDRYRQPVELNLKQSNVLRQAIAQLPVPPSRGAHPEGRGS